MAYWMRFPYLEEATDGTQGGGGAPAAPETGGEAPQKPVDIAAGMLAAIEADHTGAGDVQQTDAGATQPPADGRARDEAGRFSKAEPGATDDKSPILGVDGKPIDSSKPAEPKPKTAEDFALTEEEKRTLGPKARERFQGLIEHGKAKDAEVQRLSTENTGLAQARDAIMGVMTEYQIEAPDLTQFAEFNLKVKSGDLEGALGIVDHYRTQLLDAMGREAPGFDPLDKPEHQDLKQRVDRLELSREDAMQLVKARRLESSQQQQHNQQQQQQRSQQDVQRGQDQALNDVKAWNARIAMDVDYEAKAGNILPLLEGIIKDYPPHLWVKTLERLWATTRPAPNTQGQQQGQQQNRTPQPLRATGAQGGRASPNSMLEALESNLPHAY